MGAFDDLPSKKVKASVKKTESNPFDDIASDGDPFSDIPNSSSDDPFGDIAIKETSQQTSPLDEFLRAGFAFNPEMGQELSKTAEVGISNAPVTRGLNFPDKLNEILGDSIAASPVGRFLEVQRREEAMVASPIRDLLKNEKEKAAQSIIDSFLGKEKSELGDVFRDIGLGEKTSATLGFISTALLPSNIAFTVAGTRAARLASKESILKAAGQEIEGSLLLNPGEKTSAIKALASQVDVEDLGRNLDLKERKFISTVRESPNTSQSVADAIEGLYHPLSNSELVKRANSFIDADPQKAVSLALSDASATAESNTIAQQLALRLQKEGQSELAIEIIEKTAKKATESGQAIQALSLYSKMTPEGILQFTQRQIDRAKRLKPGLDLKLTPEVADDLVKQAEVVQGTVAGRKKLVETAKLMSKVKEVVPPTLGKQIATVQTISQLLNPKTLIRNVIGNVGFSGFENVSDVFAAGLDNVVSLFTGNRTKVLPRLDVQAKGFVRGLKQGAQEAMMGIDTTGNVTRFDVPSSPVFTNEVLRGLEKTLNVALRAPDRASYLAARNQSLINQMAAQQITLAKSGTKKGFIRPTPAMLEQAHLDGLYRTFQDDNAISQLFVGLKKVLNGNQDFGIGDLVLKYPKTPANLLARGIDYSPAGFVKATIELARPLFGRPFHQKVFVDATARALTGSTSLVGTGAILGELGIITGRSDSESTGRQALKREVGLADYRINVSALKRFVASGFDAESTKAKTGDNIVSYDWFQPSAIPLAIGADIASHRGKSEGEVGAMAKALGSIVGALDSGTTTLAEQPLVQGVKRLFSHGEVTRGVLDTFKSAPASFVPTIVNQIRQLVDPLARETRGDNDFEDVVNSVKLKIPGMSQTLAARKSVFGEDYKFVKSEGVQRFFDVFLNPAFSSKFNESQFSDVANELLKLDIAIPQQGTTLRGVELSRSQRNAIDQTTGELAAKNVAKIISSSRYRDLPGAMRVKLINSVVRASKDLSEIINISKDKDLKDSQLKAFIAQATMANGLNTQQEEE